MMFREGDQTQAALCITIYSGFIGDPPHPPETSSVLNTNSM